ncbi:MAG: hypothetical protein JWM93_2338, partial [Frankiales bacterium]|nr:hypothetical protein [Frankiales bacterium]
SGSATGTTSGSPTASASPTAGASPSGPTWTDDAGKTFQTLTESAGAIVTANDIEAHVIVHPDSVVKATVADLGKGSTVPKGKVPVFVTVTYTNGGDTTLEYPSLGTPLFAAEAGGTQAEPYTPTTSVPKCPTKDSPETFKPGSTYTDCQVFLVHTGNSVRLLTYRAGTRAGEITWKVA